jgi:hypothetical protein
MLLAVKELAAGSLWRLLTPWGVEEYVQVRTL